MGHSIKTTINKLHLAKPTAGLDHRAVYQAGTRIITKAGQHHYAVTPPNVVPWLNAAGSPALSRYKSLKLKPPMLYSGTNAGTSSESGL